MTKTIIRFFDTNGYPILDSITVKLVGPQEGTPLNNIGTPIPTVAANTGNRVFTGLVHGSYNVLFNDVLQTELSPLYIAGPITVIPSLTDNQIESNHIADDQILARHIADNQIGTAHIINDAITSLKIANAAISSSKIATASLSKDHVGSGFFNNTIKKYSTGWGIAINTQHFSWELDGSLSLAPQAVSSTHVDNSAITALHIENGAIGRPHLNAGIVDATVLAAQAVSSTHVANYSIEAQHIKADAVTLDKLNTTSLQQIVTRVSKVPVDMVYVSPDYTENEVPYFSNLQTAIDYMSDNDLEGTIKVAPGTYIGPFDIDNSISIVGEDRTRCILFTQPTQSDPAVVNVLSAGSKDIRLSALTIKCLSDNIDSTPAKGITATNISANNLLIDDIDIIVTAKSSASAPEDAIGIELTNCKFDIKNIRVISTGGSYQGGTGPGGDAEAIKLKTAANGSIYNCRLKALGGTGNTDGISRGVTLDNINIDIIVENSIIDSINEGLYSSVSISPVVLNTNIRTTQNVNVSNTKFVNVTQSQYVAVKELD